ncbi:hypothetical protein EDB92DRAFT_1943142 [Lactarius akahatsu]|uniref:Uncharacterized protein n=1 Tax=Lactarius akahatsu TaxID=416441 RepID=A0AAD4LLV1_9AGAM|nr:hypothetical protein EDB92DRAFT_1943142 [Lactarius akahatsu]
MPISSSVRKLRSSSRSFPLSGVTTASPPCLFAPSYLTSLASSAPRRPHSIPHLTSVMMNHIIDNQREILLSVHGTNIRSSQQPQQYNSQSIAWGGLSHELFAHGKRYHRVAWGYVLGLFVLVPFWLIHQYFPKLHADCLYTPVIA